MELLVIGTVSRLALPASSVDTRKVEAFAALFRALQASTVLAEGQPNVRCTLGGV
jgi:hypothetical protein